MSLSMLTKPDHDVLPCVPARERPDVSGATVALLTIVIAVVDGFWVTSLHGAVGDVASGQDQFHRWMRDSTMMLAPLALSMLAALALSHRLTRWRGHALRLVAAAVLIIGISTAVGIAEVSISAAADYTTQADELIHVHSIHTTTVVAAATSADAIQFSQAALDAARHLTLMAHVRGVEKASVVLLLTNIVLVLWVLALRGGRLWVDRGPVPEGV